MRRAAGNQSEEDRIGTESLPERAVPIDSVPCETGPAAGYAAAPANAFRPRPGDGPTDEIERLIGLLAKLPGLGPRSARRAALHLLNRRSTLLEPLAASLARTGKTVRNCGICGNFAAGDLCGICLDPERDASVICVVEGVADLWALERTHAFRGRYHVLGGALSAVGNVRPEDLRIPQLAARARSEASEVVLALNATFDGETTAHYIARTLADADVRTTRIGFGVPVGGELDYLDADTIAAAFRGRASA